MKKFISLVLLTLMSINAFAQKDEFVGFYKGDIQEIGDIYAEVYRANDNYRLKLLPSIFANSKDIYIQEKLKAENAKIEFKGEDKEFKLSGIIENSEIKAKGKYKNADIRLELKRYSPQIETLGQKAPKGAVVIFDGTNTDSLEHKNKYPCQWFFEDGILTVNPNTKGKNGKAMRAPLYTKESFEGSFKVHLEFLIPSDSFHLFGPHRNNSGIYIGGFYEVQILDSFGLESGKVDCGAIYEQSAPLVNACLEPDAWQAYDIIFTPAKFDDKNNPINDPTITVYHNGVLIQSQSPITTATRAGDGNPKNFTHKNIPLKLMFQEHKNKVSFRNIWLQKL